MYNMFKFSMSRFTHSMDIGVNKVLKVHVHCGSRSEQNLMSGNESRNRVRKPLPAVRFAACLCAIGSAAAAFSADKIDFVRDVQPILKATCYSCHGPEKQKGALRLDSKTLAMQGGKNGKSIVPGDSKSSYLMQRVRGEGDENRMPEKTDPLTKEQTAILTAWIDQGADWPDSASVAGAALKKHWAYEAPKPPAVPAVKNTAWIKNPLDAFILARLESEGLAPSPEASRETLLRRVSLDLTGLPPTLDEMNSFLADKSPDAYEKRVEQLLASPRYGERWAKLWLDLARYADTDGFNFDTKRVMWPYRDWVINALNADMPFNQFTIEQIAGDLLPNATPDQVVAAGFHRNTMKNSEGGVDPEEARWETQLDRTNTTATVWLGSTMGCSQCHNHKYDPFTQKDYYAMLAFFDNTDEITVNPKSGAAEKAEAKKEEPAEPAPDAKKPDAQEIKDEKEVKKAKKEDPKKKEAPQLTSLSFREKKTPPATDLRIRGAFTAKGERVNADVPKFLPPIPEGAPKNRLGLAQWLVSDKNPLTARVTVNRQWESLFGRGLVSTSEDFGLQGEKPTHPELLDWLATEFMQSGWKMKSLHKLIVTSATYRQSSRVTKDLLQKDPFNKLYARAPRYRLDSEGLRDNALAISGLLANKIGGPSVFPPSPSEVGRINNNKESVKWTPSPGEDRYRRGVYTFVCRTAPFAMFATFDGPSREFCTVRRARTNTPMQALSGLNDPSFWEAAQALGQRMQRDGGSTIEQRIAFAYRICTGRAPSAKETELFSKAFSAELENAKKDNAAANEIVKGFVAVPKDANVPELAALTMLANVMLNLDETVTRE
jgi:mono/diheme cytochrome c family protein